MALNLHQLRTFALVVRLGGLGAAARASGVSQPSLSRALRELEAHVGHRLVERGARGVRPTPLGLQLFEHAQSIVTAEREAERLLVAAHGTPHGVLHVGASTTIATYIVPTVLSRFSETHPGIDVRLTSAHTRVLVRMLHQFEIDLALAEAPPNDPRVLATPWMSDDMIVIASSNHRLRHARGLPVSALASERFILREEASGTRDIVLRGLADAGLVPQASIAVDGTEVMKQLVALGFGIAMVSRHAIVDQLSSARVCILDVPALRIRRPFTALSLPGRKRTSDADAFYTLLCSSVAHRSSAAP